MKLSLLEELLRGKISINKFKNNIQTEIYEYENKLKLKGSSILINIIEDCNLYFRKNDLLELYNYYLNNNLTGTQISFIADCLTLSNSISFENDELRELLEEMTDDET